LALIGKDFPFLLASEIVDLERPRSEDIDDAKGCLLSTTALFCLLGFVAECLDDERPVWKFISVSASLLASSAGSFGLRTFSVGCKFLPPYVPGRANLL
jgi:hypothetical protein